MGFAKERAADERAAHMSGGPKSSTGRSSTNSSGNRSDARSSASNKSKHSSRGGPSGYDGNADPQERDPNHGKPIVNAEYKKNFDLGMGGWSTVRGYDLVAEMPPRPKPSTLGSSCKIALNTFHVDVLPKTKVYQYDVIIGSGLEKRGLIDRVWKSPQLKNALGANFIFDGNKLAWSTKAHTQELKVLVDLDEGAVRKPGKDGKIKDNKHRVVIRMTNAVKFDALNAYLASQADFSNSVLEAITFFDHMFREYPRTHLTQIKRSFFARGQSRFELGSGVEAFKGVYQSLRIAHGLHGARLSLNVDVANGTFWKHLPLHLLVKELLGRRDFNDLIAAFRQGGEKSKAAVDLRKRMRKLHVTAKHRGQGSDHEDKYVIDKFVYTGARNEKFKKDDGKDISIYDYFANTFGIRLQFPDLPLVKMTKGKNTILPMEVLMVDENQRYQYKMDERQTSNMINFAVTPPAQRWEAIKHGLGMLDWDHDPVLNGFGVKVNGNKTIVDGRLIAAPIVKFGAGEAKPGTSGRWDLKAKKFLTPNPAVLKSWGICVIPGRRGGKPDKSVVENFIREFIKTYTMHGGRVEQKNPTFQLASGDDVGAWVTNLWNASGSQANARPQILMFVLPDKDTTTYGRIKRSAECRYGVVSQCVQYAHVQKCQGQYLSNVCMKFNAKLGGSTARAVGAKSGGPNGMFTVPTVVIGADVSHAAPGGQAASMAAMTVSTDKLATRYAAAVQTNGYRVEIITPANIKGLLLPLLKNWVNTVGAGKFPARVIYFRDGVSEGQYQHVLEQEVKDMKNMLREAGATAVQFIVVVGSKRHHIRFFPEKGDRNANPLPGTLVETGVTHPFESDFYLNSHAAIKGTARPMHYHVLCNEPKISNEELQTMIYEHCYQYIRATTPVSQHPAIYYAHIASGRAVYHDPSWGSNTPSESPSGPSNMKSESRFDSQGRPINPPAAPPLMEMVDAGSIRTSMWYI